MQALQLVVFGISTGAFLLLATLGFSLIRRVEGFLNIAHAEVMSVGAFVTWYLSVDLGWHFLLAAAVAVAVAAVVSLGLARFVFHPIKHHGPSIMLITSVGAAFIIHGVVEALIGTGTRPYTIPRLGAIPIGGLLIPPYHLIIIVIAGLAATGLALFLNRTRIGKAIRAMAIDRELAESRGVDTGTASRVTWLAAGGLAGLAGIVLGTLGTLTSDIAFQQILIIIAVALVAGLGSLRGVIAAAFIVGIAMDLSVLWLPGGYRPMIAFAMVILVLIFRPQGIAGVDTK